MAQEKIKIQNKFYGGIVRDDKSKVVGAAYNIEEIDIFSNADYIQAEQIVSTDSMPASTEIYAYTADSSDVVYGYGKETAASKVRIVSVASGGADNPGSFATLVTSSDSTNLATVVSPIQYFRTTEASNPNSLYYIKGTSTTWYVARYNIGAAAEQRWTGSAWSASGSLDSNSQLTGLNGSFMRPTMKVMFGELYICNGNYIAKIDKDGVFTNNAFTLPKDWEAVDIIPVSDVSIILARNINRLSNLSKGFWWDLTESTQVDDSFNISMGGPQWIVNDRETIKILCAINGQARIFQLTGAFPGAVPIEIPGLLITNVGTETSTQPISSAKMLSGKNNVLYFGLYKTDKTGIYGLGQLDQDKPMALVLSKRFDTTSYATHAPTAVMVQGPNFYGAFYDNGTADHCRCEGNNSPSRSSSATYETIILDDNNPLTMKNLPDVFVTTYPMVASTDVDCFVAGDYGSYAEVFRGDGTSFNTTGGTIGAFKTKAFANKKVFRIKLVLTSSTTSSPKITSIGFKLVINDASAYK